MAETEIREGSRLIVYNCHDEPIGEATVSGIIGLRVLLRGTIRDPRWHATAVPADLAKHNFYFTGFAAPSRCRAIAVNDSLNGFYATPRVERRER